MIGCPVVFKDGTMLGCPAVVMYGILIDFPVVVMYGTLTEVEGLMDSIWLDGPVEVLNDTACVKDDFLVEGPLVVGDDFINGIRVEDKDGTITGDPLVFTDCSIELGPDPYLCFSDIQCFM